MQILGPCITAEVKLRRPLPLAPRDHFGFHSCGFCNADVNTTLFTCTVALQCSCQLHLKHWFILCPSRQQTVLLHKQQCKAPSLLPKPLQSTALLHLEIIWCHELLLHEEAPFMAPSGTDLSVCSCFHVLAALRLVCNCRVSFDGDATAAMETHAQASQAAKLSGTAPTVVKAFPPPAQADVSHIWLCFTAKDCKLCLLSKSHLLTSSLSIMSNGNIITILMILIIITLLQKTALYVLLTVLIIVVTIIACCHYGCPHRRHGYVSFPFTTKLTVR